MLWSALLLTLSLFLSAATGMGRAATSSLLSPPTTQCFPHLRAALGLPSASTNLGETGARSGAAASTTIGGTPIPTGNEGVIVTGSKTVHFAGASQGRTTSLVMSCSFPVNLPTSVAMSAPMGAPVLIGGPDAMDFAAAASQAVRTKWVSGKAHALMGAASGSKRSKVICALTGHPVDVLTGELIAEAIDAEIPGLIPLTFERNYRSRETEAQSLGPGWYHFFDAYVETTPTSTKLRLPDGRPAEHDLLRVGQSYFHAPDRYTLTRESNGYTIAFPEGLTYRFAPIAKDAARCHLLVIRDRARNTVTLSYQSGYLTHVTDTANRRIDCQYHSDGQLKRLSTTEATPQGPQEHLLAEYAYDQHGYLAKVSDPRGHAIRYAYQQGVLIEETHKNGLVFHFEWDWQHPEGSCIRTWGDAPDTPSAMDLAPGAHGPKAIYDRKITYDKFSKRTLVIDGRGGRTYYEGNALDLVDKVIDPLGNETITEWDPRCWKLSDTDPNGAKLTWKYDDRGNVLAETDALGHETRKTYDNLDRLTTLTAPTGAKFEIDYHSSSKPSAIHRPDGTAFLYQYDDRGRLREVSDPMGRKTALTWTDRHDLASHTDPERRVTTLEHDYLGRLLRSQDPLGRTLRIERDPAGLPTHVERPDGEVLSLRYDKEGNLIEQTDSRGRVTRMRHAALGQLVEHTDAMGHKVKLRYDSECELVGVENQAGELYAFELDLAGRVKAEKTFSGTKRKYLHDRAGRTTQVMSGAYRLTKIERDAAGRVVKQISQGGTAGVLAKPTEESYAFDELGALVAARTADADVVFERDVLGRIIRERETVKQSGAKTAVESRYDPSGFRLERTTSLAHRAEYQYNDNGELTAVSADWALAAGAREPLRRLGLPQASMGAFEIKVARDALGQELARRLPGGVVSVWSRDRYGRASEQRVLTGASRESAGQDIMRKAYAWASAEEIASMTMLDPATGVAKGGSAYEYDPRGHLVRQLFSSGEVLERQSDPVGNLYKSQDRTDRRYGPGGVIQQANGTEYQVDADGFLVKKVLADGATWHYQWDAHGHLVQVQRPDGEKVAFTYDAFGRRTTKTARGVTTEYTWDGDDLVHERVRDTATGQVTKPLTTWVFEPGTFTPLAKLEGRKRYGIITDHLGSPTMLATEAGKIAWRAQLDVYGVPREEPGVAAGSAGAESDATANPWRFPGQYEDAETGLFYNRFRYYDPELGRYLSEDPIGVAGGVALFGYVHEPLGWVDWFGLSGGCGPRRTKHTDNRHVARAKWPTKSKFRKPSQLDSLIARTIKNADVVIEQGSRTRFERAFGRVIGTEGQQTVVVVLDTTKNKIVTAFPI